MSDNIYRLKGGSGLLTVKAASPDAAMRFWVNHHGSRYAYIPWSHRDLLCNYSYEDVCVTVVSGETVSEISDGSPDRFVVFEVDRQSDAACDKLRDIYITADNLEVRRGELVQLMNSYATMQSYDGVKQDRIHADLIELLHPSIVPTIDGGLDVRARHISVTRVRVYRRPLTDNIGLVFDLQLEDELLEDIVEFVGWNDDRISYANSNLILNNEADLTAGEICRIHAQLAVQASVAPHVHYLQYPCEMDDRFPERPVPYIQSERPRFLRWADISVTAYPKKTRAYDDVYSVRWVDRDVWEVTPPNMTLGPECLTWQMLGLAIGRFVERILKDCEEDRKLLHQGSVCVLERTVCVALIPVVESFESQFGSDFKEAIGSLVHLMSDPPAALAIPEAEEPIPRSSDELAAIVPTRCGMREAPAQCVSSHDDDWIPF